MDQDEDAFKIPDVPKTYIASQDVINYSFFLKKLGLSQKLEYGDWYCLSDKGGVVCKIYHKENVDSMNEFELFTDKNYVRIVNQEEALNLLKISEYKHPIKNAIAINPYGYTTMRFDNHIIGNGIIVSASSEHGCCVKAAYMALATRKLMTEFSDSFDRYGFSGEKKE